MSGQINATGLRDPHGASTDIVEVPPAWRRPRRRFRSAFASHRPPARPSRRMAESIVEIVVLLIVALVVSTAVAGIAYVIVEMWSN